METLETVYHKVKKNEKRNFMLLDNWFEFKMLYYYFII